MLHSRLGWQIWLSGAILTLQSNDTGPAGGLVGVEGALPLERGRGHFERRGFLKRVGFIVGGDAVAHGISFKIRMFKNY